MPTRRNEYCLPMKEHDIKAIRANNRTQHRVLIRESISKNAEWRRTYLYDQGNIHLPRHSAGVTIYIAEPWALDSSGDVIYRVDGERDDIAWRASTIMPYRARRTFIKLTDIWAEPLAAITKDGIRQEGHKIKSSFATAWDARIRENEQDLWRQKRVPTYGFDSGVWVYVYEFEYLPQSPNTIT